MVLIRVETFFTKSKRSLLSLLIREKYRIIASMKSRLNEIVFSGNMLTMLAPVVNMAMNETREKAKAKAIAKFSSLRIHRKKKPNHQQ